MEYKNASTRVNAELSHRSAQENINSDRLKEISLLLSSKFGVDWNTDNLVTLKRQSLSRILYYNHLYQQIVDIPGVICEFGVHWGSGLAQLLNLRGIYEPYNVSRRIVGFDTFEGFSAVDEKDGPEVQLGDYPVMANYEVLLEEILEIQESFSPASHIRRFELVKGDASVTISDWLANNPHLIISMAIFDMDVYKPTKDVLEQILPRLTKGSLLVFDELSCDHFPGETIALDEVLGVANLALRRLPNNSYCSWAVYEGPRT